MSARLAAYIVRTDLASFIRRAFETVSPGGDYQHNWHIDAIVHQLMRVHQGESQRLLIAQPPRSLKSICISIAYVAWLIGRDPSKRVIVVSYSNELAEELHRQFRMVVDSPWYKAAFPAVQWTKEKAREFTTTEGGGRYATSVGGTLTGRGGDVIIIDDPLNANDAHSEPARRGVIDWFTGSLVSRLNDKKHGAIIAVMQRLNEEDLAGYLLEQGGWDELILSAIATKEELIELPGGFFKLRKPGGVLHPEREDRAALERIRRESGALLFAAQYQQQPVPLEGNLIKRDWFETYQDLPNKPNMKIVLSWDVATTIGANNDFSVCTVWYVDRHNYYLADVYRARVDSPTLQKRIIAMVAAHKATALLIEEAGAGISLIQCLRANQALSVKPRGMIPHGSKIDRMAAQTARIEAGQVFLPKEAAWLTMFLNELLAFPHGKHDDQVDSVSQFLLWAQQNSHDDDINIGSPIQVY